MPAQRATPRCSTGCCAWRESSARPRRRRSGRSAPRASARRRSSSTATTWPAARSATCWWTTCGNGSPPWTTSAWNPSPSPSAGISGQDLERHHPGHRHPAAAARGRRSVEAAPADQAENGDGHRYRREDRRRRPAAELPRVPDPGPCLLPGHSPVGDRGSRRAGDPGRPRARSVPRRSTSARPPGTANRAWTRGPANDYPSCPCWSRPSASGGRTRPRCCARPAHTPPGQAFTAAGQTLTRSVPPRDQRESVGRRPGHRPAARPRPCEEDHAFWAWATVEVLRRDRLPHRGTAGDSPTTAWSSTACPTTGELVPLLQIAPSKTDKERLLPID